MLTHWELGHLGKAIEPTRWEQLIMIYDPDSSKCYAYKIYTVNFMFPWDKINNNTCGILFGEIL